MQCHAVPQDDQFEVTAHAGCGKHSGEDRSADSGVCQMRLYIMRILKKEIWG